MSSEIQPAVVELKVNGKRIELTEFVASFIAGAAGGLTTSLKNSAVDSSFSLCMSENSLTIIADGAPVKANAFVEKLVRNTMTGMVIKLKTVQSVDVLELKVEKLDPKPGPVS